MRDPFEVLGLPKGASDEQVREAYRTLARRYAEGGDSPDSKKLQELDAAYDAIILSRTGNGGSTADTSGYSGYNTYTRYDSSAPDFGDIRAKINSGRVDEAEILLDGIPAGQRTAEWHYLKGTVSHRKGWLEDAARNGDEEILRSMMLVFLDCWYSYRAKLEVLMQEKDSDLKKNADDFAEDISQLLQAINKAAEDMDIDALDALGKELDTFRFDADAQEKVSRIHKAIAEFDVDFLQNLKEM